MSKISLVILMIALLTFELLSCSNRPQGGLTPSPEPQRELPASPEPGKASVIGRVISINTSQPYFEAIIRLAEVFRNELGEGSYVLDAANSPFTTTDKNGYFIFQNIPPKEFVLVVGDPMTRYIILSENNGKPKVIKLAAGKITDLGLLKVDYDQK
jgi:hypothetical protein